MLRWLNRLWLPSLGAAGPGPKYEKKEEEVAAEDDEGALESDEESRKKAKTTTSQAKNPLKCPDITDRFVYFQGFL